MCCVKAGNGNVPVPVSLKVSGFITDLTGVPVSNAEISVSITDGINPICSKSGSTNENGLFFVNFSVADGCELIPNNPYSAEIKVKGEFLTSVPF